VAVTRAKEFVEFEKGADWKQFISFDKSVGHERIQDFLGLAATNSASGREKEKKTLTINQLTIK